MAIIKVPVRVKDTRGLKFLARIAKADRKERGVTAAQDFRVLVGETFEAWKARTGYSRADLYEKERKKMFWRARAMAQPEYQQKREAERIAKKNASKAPISNYMPRG